jgi:tetratricopeptide (TPR) repeat protein
MSDVLQRASKVLRESHNGVNPGSGFTRARILRSLYDKKRGRWSRWSLFGPLVALFLGGTAWAGATGRLPAWWAHAEAWVTTLNGPTQTASAVVQPGRPTRRAPAATRGSPASPAPPQAVKPSEDEPSAEAVEQEPPEAATNDPVASALPRVRRALAQPEAPAEVERDPELRAFRRAHDLHFKAGRPRAAVAAYDEYLRQYPHGRFVPEARYSTAVSLLKLGERERAKRILESFARGDYGTYRRAEARELLDALSE